MCQLSLVNLNNAELNRLAVELLLSIDSIKEHRDGWGFWGGGNIWRCDSPIDESTGLEAAFSSISELPVIGHVRQASVFATKGKIEFNHPFTGARYILAHNGTLKSKLHPAQEGLIDSQIFLKALEEKSSGGKEFISSIQETMSEFTGKFAFLISDTLDNKKIYVIRGKTALLYMSNVKADGKYIGFIVNTEFESIKKFASLFKLIVNTMGDRVISFEDPVLLPQETILTLEKDLLVTTEELKENTEVFDNSKNWKPETRATIQIPMKRCIIGKDEILNDWESVLDQLLEVFNKREIDELFFVLLGKSLLEVTKEDLTGSINSILPILQAHFTEGKLTAWGEILSFYSSNEIAAYTNEGIKFPYMFNKGDELVKISNRLDREAKEMASNKKDAVIL